MPYITRIQSLIRSWFTGSYSSESGVVCNSAPCHPEMSDVSRHLAYDLEYAPVLKRMRAALDRLEDERKNVQSLSEFPQKVLRNRAAAIREKGIAQSY